MQVVISGGHGINDHSRRQQFLQRKEAEVSAWVEPTQDFNLMPMSCAKPKVNIEFWGFFYLYNLLT